MYQYFKRPEERTRDQPRSSAINYPTALPFLAAYQRFGHRPEQFPNAFGDQERILSLPMFAEITRGQQDEVIDLVRKF
ncbi:hypothetical protein [Bradyrhizobium sp. LMTR 3]|uniref:hypothetical protein n=1 Tax=Bradyrhizobium sp. LMTR 3 TaxID=189873 RepID=UPI000810F187|nr:hypothetical protein [Bradyrhizobium sp. LMTR 3]OCK57487.1 hypothetical protein LMTR3_07945 [Bradyrhizobium sp. LMTR 3]